ncbi:MAG TPA: hydroxyethylthiazole kinase [Pseudolabrys sp.]|nr:hydroxyethylthiazole kinase [Pseudolabrys sp.]
MLGELPTITADILERLRARAPRVHCITNTVAQAFTANMLLAVGAIPSMTIAPEEIADFVRGADALLVNLGTCDAERRTAIGIAVDTAGPALPWVLDPVFVDRSPPRAGFAKELVDRQPAVVRLNAAEFAALAGTTPEADAPSRYAQDHDVVIALSGRADRVTDGARSAGVHNGHEWMSRVTAMGCAGSALLAACLAVESDAWQASIAAMLILGIAGEVAADRAKGPGSFAAAILDAVHALDRVTILQHAKVEP